MHQLKTQAEKPLKISRSDSLMISFLCDHITSKWLEMEDFLKSHYDFKSKQSITVINMESVIYKICGE